MNSFIYFGLFGFESGAVGDNDPLFPLFACSRVSEHYRFTTCSDFYKRHQSIKSPLFCLVLMSEEKSAARKKFNPSCRGLWWPSSVHLAWSLGSGLFLAGEKLALPRQGSRGAHWDSEDSGSVHCSLP